MDAPTPQEILAEAPVDPALLDPAVWALSPRPSPIDLATECARAMDAGKLVKRGKTYVQTIYTVYLSEKDLARFEDRRRELIASLKDTLIWWAKRSGCTFPGEIRVKVEADAALKPGQVSVEAGLRAEEATALGLRRKPDHSE